MFDSLANKTDILFRKTELLLEWYLSGWAICWAEISGVQFHWLGQNHLCSKTWHTFFLIFIEISNIGTLTAASLSVTSMYASWGALHSSLCYLNYTKCSAGYWAENFQWAENKNHDYIGLHMGWWCYILRNKLFINLAPHKACCSDHEGLTVLIIGTRQFIALCYYPNSHSRQKLHRYFTPCYYNLTISDAKINHSFMCILRDCNLLT